MLFAIKCSLAKFLVHKYHTMSVLAKNNTDFAMFRDYTKESNVVFNHYFKISTEEMDDSSDLSNTLHWVYTSYISKVNNLPKPFYNLRRVLFYISSGDTKVIDDLAILLLKVYIGRSYLRYLDNDKRNLTVCICNNKNYFKNFMMDIFNFTMESDKTKLLKVGVQNILKLFFQNRSEKSFYHVSTYSAKMLSDDKYLGALIRDKLYGNIVNLDTTDIFTVNGKFKSFLSGEKVSITDPVFGKLSYRSNAQYIYITEVKNLPESSFSGVPHSILHFTGDLSKSKYEPLNGYELFFLVTGLLHYALDLIDAPYSNETDLFQSNSAVPSVSSLIDTFIDEFCDDTTGTISNQLIQNIPLDSIIGSKNEKERKEQVKRLQIDKLDFIFSKDLCSCFNKWIYISYPTVESCSDDDFTKMIIAKYHIIFYNKVYGENMGGKKLEARGFYGLKIKVDELEKYLSQETQKKMTVSSEESQKHFTDYLENIISNYYKFQI